MQEKRSQRRFDLQLATLLSFHGGISNRKSEVFSKNVSSHGVFLLIKQGPTIGSDVKVEMLLPVSGVRGSRGCDSRLFCSGSVVRRDEEGIAVSFSKICKIRPVLATEVSTP